MARGGRRTSAERLADVKAIGHKLERALQGRANRPDVNAEMLAHRVPVHLGGISDPFADAASEGISCELLQILALHHYPVIISTKNPDALLHDAVIHLLKRSGVAVQISLATLSPTLAALIEPNAPTPQRRLGVMAILSAAGIPVFARIQPLLLPWASEVAADLVPALSAVGCQHVMVEHLKLPLETNISLIRDFLTAVGWNAYHDYQECGATRVGRKWILPNQFKWDRLQGIVEVIHQHGMTYGAADYGLTHLGDTDCCCGVDRLPAFTGWFRASCSNVVRQAVQSTIRWEETYRYWIPSGAMDMYVNSHCRLPQSSALADYLRDKWNRPGTANAPDSLLGIKWSGERDENGDCIYVREISYGCKGDQIYTSGR